jgi:hypothetical protein
MLPAALLHGSSMARFVMMILAAAVEEVITGL